MYRSRSEHALAGSREQKNNPPKPPGQTQPTYSNNPCASSLKGPPPVPVRAYPKSRRDDTLYPSVETVGKYPRMGKAPPAANVMDIRSFAASEKSTRSSSGTQSLPVAFKIPTRSSHPCRINTY